MVRWLSPVPGNRILDAGCGTAGFTQLLAEPLGDDDHVDAADTSEHLLEFNRSRFADDPIGKRIQFHEAPIQDLPFEDETFDLVWTSLALHHLADRLSGVRELVRVVTPGGRLAIREGGIGARFMPTTMELTGTGLNERLSAAMERWFASHVHFEGDAVPYPYGWTQLLRDAGMADVTARTFIHEFLPPFSDEQQQFLIGGLTRWATDESREGYLSEKDRSALKRLIDPDDTEYVFDRPDLHFIQGITIYVGQKPS
ncbi:MAG: methyltransferase domain-containing protein [Dehalococcoidia bacterium]|jgi:ubiquinone/menaquinone biosynthesis C-methylase UbiE|nr:methyltransferase domain-containing protein [Dehalococcoidia bacterium]